jgi:hypothetical protein
MPLAVGRRADRASRGSRRDNAKSGTALTLTRAADKTAVATLLVQHGSD